MATVAFGFAGAAIAGSMTTTTGVVFAGMTAAGIGMAIGATIGSVVDTMYLMPMLMGGAASRTGPRLDDLAVQTATEGSPINICYGPECQCVGTVMWAPDVVEDRVSETSGGKNGGSTTYYRYLADFAVLVCRNEVNRVRKIWADGKLVWDSGDTVGNASIVNSNQISVDVVVGSTTTFVYFHSPAGGPNLNAVFGRGRPFQTSGFANAGNNRTDWVAIRSSENGDGSTFVQCRYRSGAVDEAAGASVTLRQEGDESDITYGNITVYNGTMSQTPDPTMEATEGAGNVPAFKGSTYVVFENYNCRNSGNRLPQLRFLVEEATTRTLASVIADILERFGLTSSDYDVTAVTGNVTGYVLTGPVNGAKALEPLMLAYNIGVQESDGKLRFFMRNSPATIDVDETELAAHEEGEDYERLVSFTREASSNLPAEVVVNYIEAELDWQQASQAHRRQQYLVDSTATFDVPMTMTAGEAQAISQRLLYTSWAERVRVTGSLPASYLHLEEGDHLTFDVGNNSYEVRVDELTRGHNLRVEFHATVVQSQTNTTFEDADSITGGTGSVSSPPDCIALMFDLPPLSDEQATSTGYYFGTFALDPTASFVGAAYKISTDGTNFSHVTELSSEMTGGFADTALGDGDVGWWDRKNTVDIVMHSGTLSSATESEVLAGTNWAVLGNEVIAFQTATHLGDNIYRLSTLLRGLRDTGDETGTHAIADAFALLEGISFANLSYATLGTRHARSVATGLTTASADTTTVTLTGKTVKSFAPCHLAGQRNSSNDLVITWRRRGRGLTRLFSGAVPALLEGTEEYAVELYDGVTLLRTVTVTSATTTTYTAAQQTTDGLTPGDPVTVRVYQNNATYGRGRYTEETL